MKYLPSILLVIALCAVMLVGCADNTPVVTPDGENSTTTTVTVPAFVPPTPAGDLGTPFIGFWDVQAIKNTMVKLELRESGEAIMTAAGGQTLSGRFEVTSETEVTLTFSKPLSGTYVIEGDTITIHAENDDVLILTKAAS